MFLYELAELVVLGVFAVFALFLPALAVERVPGGFLIKSLVFMSASGVCWSITVILAIVLLG